MFRTLETLQPYNHETTSIFAVHYGFQPRFQEWFHGFTGFLVSQVSKVSLLLLLLEEGRLSPEAREEGIEGKRGCKMHDLAIYYQDLHCLTPCEILWIAAGLGGDMKLKSLLVRKRREAFCLHYMTTMNGSQAALAAGYSQKNPRNARIVAWYLLKLKDVQDRLAELAEATSNETVMTLTQRKAVLSEMIRADDRPLECIELMNKMDGLYRGEKKKESTPGIVSVAVVQKKRQDSVTIEDGNMDSG